MAWPILNWKEIELLAQKTAAEIEGLFVDKIIVPERREAAGGYLKGEWAIRLTGRQHETTLIVSVRARRPYFFAISGKGPKAALEAKHSGFDLNLAKNLRGLRLDQIKAVPRERTVILWFRGDGEERLGLVLTLIPALPEALLVRESRVGDPVILTRSRIVKEDSGVFKLPDGLKSPDDLVVRKDLVENFSKQIETEIQNECFETRKNTATRAIEALCKQARERIRQSQTAIQEAEQESHWSRWGDLLKSNLGTRPPLQTEGKASFREVLDYTTGQPVRVPGDPKLSLKEQVEKFYSLARRKERRVSEAQSRLEGFQETLAQLDRKLAKSPQEGDWEKLAQFEAAAGIGTTTTKTSRKKSSWSGRSLISHDGMAIWVGKSRDENLELTFKCARGNDLWLHLRGKPGAHVVIPLSPGKSAPLETLLDAATLVIHYSGGQNWGKTEVDYTFKKYVKRIKDSTEASYTNNKTLTINPDPARLKRLLE